MNQELVYDDVYELEVEMMRMDQLDDIITSMITEYEDLCNISDLGNQNKGFSKDAKAILKNHPVIVFHNVDIPTYTEVLNNNAALESFNINIQAACEGLLKNIWKGIVKIYNWIVSKVKKLFNKDKKESINNYAQNKKNAIELCDKVINKIREMDERNEKTEFSLREVYVLVEEEGKKNGYNETVIMMAKQAFANYYSEDYNRKHGSESFTINTDKTWQGLSVENLNEINKLISNTNVKKILLSLDLITNVIKSNGKVKISDKFRSDDNDFDNLINFDHKSMLDFSERPIFDTKNDSEKEIDIALEIINKILNEKLQQADITKIFDNNINNIESHKKVSKINDNLDIIENAKDIQKECMKIKECTSKLLFIVQSVSIHIRNIPAIYKKS